MHINRAICATLKWAAPTGITSPKRLIAHLRTLTDQEIPADLIERMASIREIRNRREHAKHRPDAARYFDLRTLNRRLFPHKILADAQDRELARAVLRLPISAAWRKDRRAEIEKIVALPLMPHESERYERSRAIAIYATLEAIPRIARRWGWELRYSSPDRGGHAASRYIVSGDTEVRLSDHEIPTADDRPWSMKAIERADRPVPKWQEIIIDRHTLTWTQERWRQELEACRAGEQE